MLFRSAYVVATLEALIADTDSFPTTMSPKVGLYHLFMASWASISLNVKVEAELDAAERAHHAVSQLTPRSRQAFLLRTVEGFSPEEVAVILSITVAQVDDLVLQAGREIADRVATDVLIIEDEALIAQAYFTRRNDTSPRPPTLGLVLMNLSSSPFTVIGRTDSPPSSFGQRATDQLIPERLLLRDGVPDDVVCSGKTFTHIERHTSGLAAHFADGTSEDGDILIGADGAVISTSARGGRLAQLLEERLPAATPPAP